jgi:hypothetical protein
MRMSALQNPIGQRVEVVKCLREGKISYPRPQLLQPQQVLPNPRAPARKAVLIFVALPGMIDEEEKAADRDRGATPAMDRE